MPPIRFPRRPAVRSHHEPRETEFVSLLLAETEAPATVPADPAPVEEDDDDLPPYMRPDFIERVPQRLLDAPVRHHSRKLK